MKMLSITKLFVKYFNKGIIGIKCRFEWEMTRKINVMLKEMAASKL